MDLYQLTAVVSRGGETNGQVDVRSFRIVDRLDHIPESSVLERSREVQVTPQHLQEVVSVSTCHRREYSLKIGEKKGILRKTTRRIVLVADVADINWELTSSALPCVSSLSLSSISSVVVGIGACDTTQLGIKVAIVRLYSSISKSSETV